MSLVSEVYKNIYQTQIPLPGSPLKELNCYIIKGKNRNLVIDVGFNNDACMQAIKKAFSELSISIDNTDMFITHLHSDHAGLSSSLKTDNNKIYASEYDSMAINSSHLLEKWDKIGRESVKMGFSKEEILNVDNHPGYNQRGRTPVNHDIVKPGDIINIGEYNFEVVDLSGHTPGQVGLYEQEHKILFCGDHILNKITPNITFWSDDFDALGVYLEKLKQVYKMNVSHLFTSHRARVDSHTKRIDQLLLHHKNRLELCIEILKNKEGTVFEVATKLNWDFAGGDFLSFPKAQKWFAAGETYAHLEHLCKQNKIAKRLENGVFIYSV